MDLLERYLGAIRSQLPEAQKADVTAELRDVLMSQVEDREAELGRSLSRDEMSALLKTFGHPLVVAGRYRKFNQLIGPEVFPFYWFALRTVLAIVLVVQVIVAAVAVATTGDPAGAVGDALGRIIGSLVAALGWVTVAFVAVEYAGAVNHLHRWQPHQLPPPIIKPRKSRFDAVMELAFTIVFIAWWSGLAPWAKYAANVASFEAGPMREVMHWPVLWLAIAGVAVSALEVVRPSWNRLTVSLSMVWHLAAFVALLVYLSGGPLVVASSPEGEGVQHGLNLGLTIALGFATFGMAAEAARDGWWLVRGRRKDGGSVFGAAAR